MQITARFQVVNIQSRQTGDSTVYALKAVPVAGPADNWHVVPPNGGFHLDGMSPEFAAQFEIGQTLDLVATPVE